MSAHTTPTRDTNTNTYSEFQTVAFCREDVGAGAPMGQEVHGAPVVTPSIVTEAALSDIEHSDAKPCKVYVLIKIHSLIKTECLAGMRPWSPFNTKTKKRNFLAQVKGLPSSVSDPGPTGGFTSWSLGWDSSFHVSFLLSLGGTGQCWLGVL